MSFVYKCDRCSDIYEHGFTGTWSKSIRWGSKSIIVDIKIRPPHLCKKCTSKFLLIMTKEIKQSYTKEAEDG